MSASKERPLHGLASAVTQAASASASTQAASASTQGTTPVVEIIPRPGSEGKDTVGLLEELNDEINGVDDEEVEADVAADSGACAHVVGPNDFPGNVKI